MLDSYDRLPSAAVSFSRRNLFKRDHWTCQYCGLQPGGDELTIDHMVPRSQGGTSTWENCVLACVTCNKRKADRTPQQAGLKLRRAGSSVVEADVCPPHGADRKLVEVRERSVLEREVGELIVTRSRGVESPDGRLDSVRAVVERESFAK